VYPLSDFGFDTRMTIYVGLVAVALNLLVAVVGTLILRATDVPDGPDETTDDDYYADEGDPRVRCDLDESAAPSPAGR